MTRKDEILNKPYSDNGAYRVPEGYFSTLNQRILDRLPEEQPQAKAKVFRIRSRYKYAAAACMAGIIIGVGALFFHNHLNENAAQIAAVEAAETETISDEYMRECMDYAMVDNNDIYTYLAEQ